MRNPDVEVKTVLTPSGVGHGKIDLEASISIFLGLENTCRQMWNGPVSNFWFVLGGARFWSREQFPFEQHTIPARVTLWFLKPSRHVGKGNALENVHVSAESEADVIPLHHATLGVHNPKLEILHKGLCKILELVSFNQFIYTIMLRWSIKLKTPLVFSLIITEKCIYNRINVQLCLIFNPVY